ncbi:AbrB/MazE/SpoVT family DNA-binding domain-containing protein [Bacillus mycoides]|uniref:AbrB/MazE/SpoVT family DNA-binding domain-containing protein n=1 Tax=Bacillus mycoides TaxID=1405 RepID=UPI0018797F29|nr:AbrB/MazE/SpoVT family DNA-binding domain-containing protein [Bacillus mycoides]MBE7129774.1 AbrB/MazE/SpoVT family DNA-binding domain-containing protein [Bacillus mycoides]
MRSIGITRKIDGLGRVVLPKELRRTFDIHDKTPMEIFVDGEAILLKKYETNHACMITGEVSEHNLSLADGKINVSPQGAKFLVEALQQFLLK